LRRAQTADPAALLVDQHERLLAADGLQAGADKGMDLNRVSAIASEQDDTSWAGRLEKRVLGGGQGETSETGDESAAHGCLADSVWGMTASYA
jgi:hypothetical protein